MCPSTHELLEKVSGKDDLAVLNLSEFKLLKSKDSNDLIPDGFSQYFDSFFHNVFILSLNDAHKPDNKTSPSIILSIISTIRLLL